ncbi:MAG: NAD(P)/FAD-dependent oxidoreductase, partial [Candidatus Dadabacteria bacterium]
MARDMQIAIIGAGFAGLGMGVRLKQAGFENFTIYEKEDGVGGTWRVNTYPGAACDVQSHLYSFSFEQNPDWSRMFGTQQEILDYLEHVADKFQLRPHLRCHREAVGAEYDERQGIWRISFSDGEVVEANVVVSGAGGLSRPALPNIPGIDDYEGTMFHSARWRHDVDLTGKRVAVIGTGASAIQIVPQIAPLVGKLDLYQRTPPWILPKPDRPVRDWEKLLYRHAPGALTAQRLRLYSTLELRVLGFTHPQVMKPFELAAKRFLKSQVPDPELRKKLTPNYTIGCKRILLANDYYPALMRDNVELISGGAAALTAGGVVDKQGVERPADVVVMCTGFYAAENVAPFPILGRGGRSLDDAWRDGPEAYLGTTVHGFPNAFLIVGPNTGLGHSSMVYMIESQINYIMSALKQMDLFRLKSVEVREDVQHRYNERLQKRLARTVWNTDCASWYKTASGKNTTLWPSFTFAYRARTRLFQPWNYHLEPGLQPARGTVQPPRLEVV